jgi:hypothetical protein
MVEIRVALADAASAHGLLRRFVGLFDRSAVSYDATRNEVRVHSEWESRSVAKVVDTVESWLAADGVGPARLSIGGRSHTLVCPARAATAGEQA